MEWNAVVHARLSVPVLPPPEQVVLVYVSSLRQFAVGQHRAGAWTIQPPLAGTVTHWAVLTPPGTSATATATTPATATALRNYERRPDLFAWRDLLAPGADR